MRDVTSEIGELLACVEVEHGVEVLYACESGSRAWGFASPDSDYDIRFLFRRPVAEYLEVGERRDVIELEIRDDLDPGGWDVRKAAYLLGSSNGALIEWLHSPIVYREEPGFLERWRMATSDAISVHRLANHYGGLAKQVWRAKLQEPDARAKDYLYAMRAFLAAEWVLARRERPPVPFDELVETARPEVQDWANRLLEWKAVSGEKERIERIDALDHAIETSIASLETQLERASSIEPERSVLTSLFQDTIGWNPGHVWRAMPELCLSRVRDRDVLLFDAVAGSHAYGTAVESSDEDRRGVFVAPPGWLLGLDSIEQVSDEKSDQVYYEVGRFVELLLKNNPNALELLGMPDDCIRFRHPAFDLIGPDIFLSKLCADTFAGYALGQIRKARGLNKKIVNPEPEVRKRFIDFCHILVGQGTVPLEEWCRRENIPMGECGLVSAQGAPNTYAVFHDPGQNIAYRGITSRKDPDVLICSSVPREAVPVAWMVCNPDAFKSHCRRHREYWQWVEVRNEERYRTNTEHGRGYDSKNLMHTLRLLDMAEEIAREGRIRVRRPNRDFLLSVRSGEFEYEDLVARAEDQVARVEEAFAASSLPPAPDRRLVNELLLELRAAVA